MMLRKGKAGDGEVKGKAIGEAEAYMEQRLSAVQSCLAEVCH